MRQLTITALLVILASVAYAQAHKNTGDAMADDLHGSSAASSTPIPVIVELFTSEGCSSCPPADALLVRLEGEQSVAGAQIVALEEHVDYWDDLGWRDPFSSNEFTERQRHYAESFHHGGPYTPQMVVDGRFEFVGSRSDQARKAIASSATAPRAIMTVARNSATSGQPDWTVSVRQLPATADTVEVWMAVTETGLHSNVEAGENSGRNLVHAAVVRQLMKLGDANAKNGDAFTGTAKIAIPPNWKKENLQVVAFVQERKSRQIVGASSTKFLQ
jgi:hypothetical protein